LARIADTGAFLVAIGALLLRPFADFIAHETQPAVAWAIIVLTPAAWLAGSAVSRFARALPIFVLIFAAIGLAVTLAPVGRMGWDLFGRTQRWTSMATTAVVATQAAALLLVSRCHPAQYSRGQWLSLAVMLFCALALVARCFGVRPFANGDAPPSVPVVDAIGLFLLAVGTALARPADHPVALYAADDLGGYAARRLVPLTIVFPFVLGVVALWRNRVFPAARDQTIAFDVVATALFFGTVVVSLGRRLSLLDQAARRDHERKEAVLRAMTEGLALFDAGGVLVGMNPAALLLHGFDRRDVQGLSVNELSRLITVFDLAGTPVEVEQWPASRVLRGEAFQSLELQVTRVNGPRWIASYGGAPVRECGGRVALAVLTFRDVTGERETERKLADASKALGRHALELEQMVAQRTEQLTETVHELERFSYSLSHDLRAPLRAMRGYAELLQSTYGERLAPDGMVYLGRITTAAGRLDELIKDVLTYSGVVRQRVVLSALSLDALMPQLIAERPGLQPPNAEITVRYPLGSVMGHEAYLTQVFSHLLYNAVKFVPSGVKPRVEVWSERHGTMLSVFVRDHGIGISADDQKRLFGMFERLNAEYEGTGMGLSIARKATERMGGRIGVESKLGRGTTFWVDLASAP
jgi:PAS domain S-box-containing protein